MSLNKFLTKIKEFLSSNKQDENQDQAIIVMNTLKKSKN